MTEDEYKDEIRRRDEIIDSNKNIAAEWLKMKGRLDMLKIAAKYEDDILLIKNLIFSLTDGV